MSYDDFWFEKCQQLLSLYILVTLLVSQFPIGWLNEDAP